MQPLTTHFEWNQSISSKVFRHPCKSYSAETKINTATKTKSNKGHNSAKILLMITHIELDLYFTMINASANSK